MMRKGNMNMRFEVVKTLAPYGFQVVDTKDGTVKDTFKRKYQARAHAFYLGQNTFVERTNLMTGKKFKESVDTPYYCSPSSETYWSM
jgi:hypothetical protein